MRAFLSYSSQDKVFVDSVAKELGRQFCVYDDFCFNTGDEFREAIRKGLDSSSIFALFASKNSLASHWVNFEKNEAEIRLIQGSLSRVLVFLLEDDVSHEDLPEWIRKVKVSNATSSKAVVKEIQQHIQELFLERQQPIYVGRQKERLQAEEKLLEFGVDGTPRMYFAWGLAGIGRRTFSSRIANDLFNIRKQCVFRLKEGDDIKDIAIQMADEAEVFNSVSDLKFLVNEIRSERNEQSLDRINRYAETLNRASIIPIFLDDGGIIDADGNFSLACQTLIRQLDASGQIYCAFVLTRKPRVETLGDPHTKVPAIRVEPLSSDDIARLIGRLASVHNLRISREEVRELSDHLRGYPPAAHFAIDLIKDYGVSAILANKVAIASFQSRRFVAYLDKHSALSGLRTGILSLLCYYSPLPLNVIGQSLRANADDLSTDLTFLIDISLVIPESGLYRIADPVIDSVLAIVDRSQVPHKALAESLEQHLQGASAEDESVLELSRALRRASLLAGLEQSEYAIAFISDLFNLQKRSYHDRDYEASIKFGKEALTERPDSWEARSYLVRGYAQLEQYEDALLENDRIRKSGLLQDAYFLEGFVERLRGNTSEAIVAYKEALRRGRRGLAIHRELALCYVVTGAHDEARKHLDAAENIQSDNRYIIDLQIQIAIRQGDSDVAKRKLELLHQVDKEEFYYHRKSTVELMFGAVEEATKSIKHAISLTNRPTAAMVTQATRCAIESKDFESADICIDTLRRKFPNRSHKVLPGLECRYEIARGKHENAMAILESKIPREFPIYKVLRLRLIKGLLEHKHLDGSTHGQYEMEYKELERLVKRDKIIDLDSEL